MAEPYLTPSSDERLEALGVAATASGRPVHLLEKDIWVVWALQGLFESELGEHLVFKGGTSLSKGYDIIERLSEDIDITYDVRQIIPELAKGDPPIPASRRQADSGRSSRASGSPRGSKTKRCPSYRSTPHPRESTPRSVSRMMSSISTKRHGADMARLARQSFRAHDDRSRVEAFSRLASRNAVVGSDEGQRHEVGYFRHATLLAGIGMKSPAHIGVRDGLHQFAHLKFQKLVRDDQRADGGSHVAVARRDRLVDGSLKPVRVLCVRL
jgi:Nucleotidyl transferase AbiEii toxin, Type IV TA system